MNRRVILADDHALIVEGLRPVVEASGCELVATVSDGRVLVEASLRLKPDLLITDISMPLLNGVEAVRQVKKEVPEIKVIFLSMHSGADYVREAFRAGASGYLLKSAAIGELGSAIQEVLTGRQYISPKVTTETVAAFLSRGHSPGFGKELTPRQREVLQLLAEGKQAKEIANVLNVSVKTIDFHKTSIMDALGLRTTAELTRYAIEHGMVGS